MVLTLYSGSITDEPELLTTQTPRIPAAAGDPQYPAHGFDSELSPMIFDEDILHFRRFAKYVAAFWRMASSSACSASWRLRRAISTDISCSRSEELRALLILHAPCVERGFVQTEFPGSGSNTDTFRKLQGFVAELRRVLFAGLLIG